MQKKIRNGTSRRKACMLGWYGCGRGCWVGSLPVHMPYIIFRKCWSCIKRRISAGLWRIWSDGIVVWMKVGSHCRRYSPWYHDLLMETIQRALKGAWSARTEKNKKRRFSGKRKEKKEEIKCAWWGRAGRCLGQISGFCAVRDWLADNVLPSNRIKLVFYCANAFMHVSFFNS